MIKEDDSSLGSDEDYSGKVAETKRLPTIKKDKFVMDPFKRSQSMLGKQQFQFKNPLKLHKKENRRFSTKKNLQSFGTFKVKFNVGHLFAMFDTEDAGFITGRKFLEKA